MQGALKDTRRFGLAEPLAVVLAASVVIVAASRTSALPREDSPKPAVAARVAPPPLQDDIARMLADMKLHD